MKYDLVAFDSFGVKSDCFIVKTDDLKICVDPGIATETGSFPLPAHEKLWLREKYGNKIRRECLESDIIILTHYHFDHHIPDQSLYKGKTLLVKDPNKKVNKSQRRRAADLLDGLDADIKIADEKKFKFGKARVSFSKPLWHGVKGTNLGYVLMVEIKTMEKSLLYTSDVDGPILKEPTDLIIDKNPDILILDGPPTYLLGFIMAYYNLARSILNVCRILEVTDSELIVFDHHLVRDYRYPALLYEVYERARKMKKNVCTAAELANRKSKVLEGYEKYGATRWKNWDKFEKEDMINVIKNAVENDLIEEEWLRKAEEFRGSV